MLRLLRVYLLAIVVGVFCISPLAFAVDGGTFGGSLTLAAADLTFPDGVDRTYTPSSGVFVEYGFSALNGNIPAGIYYWVAAQHVGGTYKFAQHSENTTPYFLPASKGVWLTTAPASITIAPGTDFAAWSNE